MLQAVRTSERMESRGEPTASPMPSSMIGFMSGDTNMAPMMTAELLRTSPRVAIPSEMQSCIQ
jgi:hypothetical protein